MQGRLSPAENNRFQFFPNDWVAEFQQAKKLGFDGLCWFLDLDKPSLDPVKDIWGNYQVLVELDRAVKILPIRGIDCGRYSFFGPNAETTIEDFKILLPILAPRLTGGIISIPLLENNFPKSLEAKNEVIKNLRQIAGWSKNLGLKIALETEWPAGELIDFLKQFDQTNIGVCYDIGNATSYGFDCSAEIQQLGQKIFDVHLKDRKVHSTQSMMLGTGDADFPSCFKALKEIDYRGGFTMQAWRGEDYLTDAKTQLTFIKKCLSSQ